MATRASSHDLAIAAEWLDVNEGEEMGEMESCRRVAAWLREEIARRYREGAIRQVARETGKPAGAIRKLMKEKAL